MGLGSRDRKLSDSLEKRRRERRKRCWCKYVGTGIGAQDKPEGDTAGGREGDEEETAFFREQRRERGRGKGPSRSRARGKSRSRSPGRLTCDLGQPSAASASSSAFFPFSPPRRRLRFGDSPAEHTRRPSRKRQKKANGIPRAPGSSLCCRCRRCRYSPSPGGESAPPSSAGGPGTPAELEEKVL